MTKFVNIQADPDKLQCLCDVANHALQDLYDGLADGTYEDDEIAGWSSDDIEKALNHVK
jgi:hypothetical protein